MYALEFKSLNNVPLSELAELPNNIIPPTLTYHMLLGKDGEFTLIASNLLDNPLSDDRPIIVGQWRKKGDTIELVAARGIVDNGFLTNPPFTSDTILEYWSLVFPCSSRTKSFRANGHTTFLDTKNLQSLSSDFYNPGDNYIKFSGELKKITIDDFKKIYENAGVDFPSLC
jgi:hypothetical protein